jgi:hypothetical protein
MCAAKRKECCSARVVLKSRAVAGQIPDWGAKATNKCIAATVIMLHSAAVIFGDDLE